MQSDSNWEQFLRIGDVILKSHMDVSNGHFQIFDDIRNQFLDERVLSRIFYDFCKTFSITIIPITTTSTRIIIILSTD